MGGLFDKPKAIKAPPVPDPPPIPTVTDEADEFARKEERKASGISKTFLTGNLSPRSTGKKKSLGQ